VVQDKNRTIWEGATFSTHEQKCLYQPFKLFKVTTVRSHRETVRLFHSFGSGLVIMRNWDEGHFITYRIDEQKIYYFRLNW